MISRDIVSSLDWHHTSAKYLQCFQELIFLNVTFYAFAPSETIGVASITNLCAYDTVLAHNASGHHTWRHAPPLLLLKFTIQHLHCKSASPNVAAACIAVPG